MHPGRHTSTSTASRNMFVSNWPFTLQVLGRNAFVLMWLGSWEWGKRERFRTDMGAVRCESFQHRVHGWQARRSPVAWLREVFSPNLNNESGPSPAECQEPACRAMPATSAVCRRGSPGDV